jgi:hypothetical protein
MSPPARRNLTPAEVAYYRGQEYLEEKGPVGRQKGVEGNADKMSAFSRTSEAIARRRIRSQQSAGPSSRPARAGAKDCTVGLAATPKKWLTSRLSFTVTFEFNDLQPLYCVNFDTIGGLRSAHWACAVSGAAEPTPTSLLRVKQIFS